MLKLSFRFSINLLLKTGVRSIILFGLLVAGASQAQDQPPSTTFNFLDPATLTPGVIQIAGTSSDDQGITSNRLFIKSRTTGKFWNGSAWVDNWAWFAPTGLTNWSHSLVLAAGDYDLRAWTWDLAGQRTGPKRLRITVAAIDTTPPTIAFNAMDAATLTPGAVQISGKSNDDQGISLNRLWIKSVTTGKYWNGSSWVDNWSWFVPTGSTNWSHSLVLAVGDYDLRAWTWDLAGQRTGPKRLRITVAAIDTTPPTIAFNAMDAATLTPGAVQISGKSNDDQGISLNRLWIKSVTTGKYWNGSSWVDNWSWFVPTGLTNWSHSLVLAAGDYDLRAWTWDLAGTRTGPTRLRLSVLDPANEAPVAVADSVQVTSASAVTIDVVSNDTDADGTIDPLTVVAASPAPQRGTITIDSVSGAITYTPNANGANGTTDTFGYTVKDDAGDDSNIGIVTVTYNLPVNGAPVAVADSIQVNSASAVTINAASNDTDADGTIDPQTVVAASPAPLHGTITIDATTGAITYTANANIATDTVDTFGYQVSDDDGDISNVAIVTVTISPVATQQLLTNADFSNQLAGWNTCGGASAVTVDGSNNAVIGNSNCIVQDVDVTANQQLNLSCDVRRLSAGSEYAAVTMIYYSGNGSYLSEAPAAIVDSVSFQTYTVSGTAPAGVSFAQVMIYTETGAVVSNCSLGSGGGGGPSPPNQLPVANNDAATISAGSAQAISVLSNDSDTDGTLDINSVVITTLPANGTAVAQADGTVLYTHDGGTSTADSFSYTVNDDDGDSSNTAQVSIAINTVVVSNGLTAFHRQGQTFLTWAETDPLDGYHVYRHSAPITAGNLAAADKITSRWGPLDNNTSVHSNGGSNVPTHFVINDLGAALSDDTGLFVYTTQPGDSANAWYAVTSVSNGVERLSSVITTASAINESVSKPQDVLTVSVNQGKGRIYTQFMDYQNWNPTFNGYAYSYTVALPSNYNPGTSYPLMLELHAHSEPYKFVNESEYNWQVITLFPSDPGLDVGESHSWWYGYARDHNYNSGTAPTSGPIANFTEQRVMRAIESVIDDSDFNVDTNKVHGLGHSMGGSGVLSLGLRYGSILSGVYASQPMTDYNNANSQFQGELNLAWGTRGANLPIVNSGPYGQDIAFYGVGGVQSVGVWDWMDHQKQLVDRRADDFAFLMTFHGKQDSIINWQSQGQPLVQAFTDANAGFSARNYGNIPHTWVGFESVVTSLFGFGNGADFPWKYPLNLSYPAIQNASGSSAINPPNSGNDAYNMDIEWATPHTPFAASIVDQAKRYEISLRSTGAAQTADITPRRTQQFDPNPGQQCDWAAIDNSTSQTFASGSATVDVDSLLTIPAVSIMTGAGTRLVIDCGSGQPINPTDPVDPGTGVSCPTDIINVQAVLDDAFQGQGYFTTPLLSEPYDCVVSTYNQAGTISRVIEFANCSDPAVSQACLNNGGQTGPYYSVETESNCYIEGPDTGVEADTACIDQATGLPQYKSFSRASISLEELQQCAIDFGCDVDFTSPSP